MIKYSRILYVFLMVYLSANIYVTWYAHKYVLYDTKLLQPTYACIVLGAGLGEDGTMSDFFKDRLLTALELYRNKTVMRLLISGDHGSKNYNEVDAAKDFLLQNGVAPNDIFLDHAGFDTYDSMYRAKEIFGITEAIVVSQAFHLPRAIYIFCIFTPSFVCGFF
jgi:SanA protein